MDKRKQARIAVAAAALLLLGSQFLLRRERAEATHANAEPAAARMQRAADGSIRIGTLVFRSCELAAPRTGATTAAYCAPFAVAENPAEPAGRQIDLKLALVASEAAAPEIDPVVLLAGGPGQAATQVWAQAAGAFAPLLARRNVILLDQRGTGGSNALTCKHEDDSDVAAPDLGRVREYTRACLQTVSSHADPRWYTTTLALDDLEAVRKALGGPRFNLVGVSYGTRVAQQYAKRYPAAVRSILLDSAVPNDNALGTDFAVNLDASLKAQFKLCTQDPRCHAAFGDPWANLQQLRAALRDKPVQASYRDPDSNAPTTHPFGARSLASLVRMYAYMPEMSALLPLGIARAQAGDYASLAAQAQMLDMDMSSLAETAMPLSVICSEDADRLVVNPADADTVLGTSLVEALKAQCEIWPRGTRPDDFNAPLRGDLPVLLLAGEFDPVTPPRYAEAIARELPHARVLLARGQGHSLLGRGCFPKLAARFVDTLDAAALDASCVDNFAPIPAFIDYNGAAP